MDKDLSGISSDSGNEDSQAPKPQGKVPETKSEPTSTKPDPSTSPIRIKHAHTFIYSYLSLVVIVAIMGGIYSWQHKKVESLNTKVSSLQKQVSDSSANLSSTKTWTYENVYSLVYPSTWTVGEDTGADQQTASPLITFTPPGASTSAYPVIFVQLGSTSDLNAYFPVAGVTSNHASPIPLTIKGYKALYQQSASERVTYYAYAVTNGSVSIFFEYKASQQGGTALPNKAVNELAEYTSFVKSVTFIPNKS